MKTLIFLVAITYLGRQIIPKRIPIHTKRLNKIILAYETVKQDITLFLNSIGNTMVYVTKLSTSRS